MRRWLLGAALAASTIAAAGFTTEAPAQAPTGGVRYLLFVRHGIYDYDSTADDRTGNALNPLGREQARAVGERLRGLGVARLRLLTSDFTRARETADTIGRVVGLPAVRDTLLRECTPTQTPPATAPGAAEEAVACDSSLARAWARYVVPAEQDAHDVLVCHGNVIRWFVARALGLDARRWRGMDIGNASVTVIAVRPDGTTRLVAYSDVGHLAPRSQTWSGRGWGLPKAAR
jgi:serine/threonine-protein phosphatase PGAM5